MYRIRFHGRGGQGVKTAGRVLSSALFREGFEVQDAPRYGAERRGAPIFSYVRADRAPIRERGNITRPDLVVVADDTLVPIPAAGVLAGLTAHSVLLINTAAPAAEWRRRLNLPGPVVVLPAQPELAEDRAELPFLGAMCAGAAARLLGVVGRGSLAAALRDELGPLGESVLAKNLERALWAFDAAAPDAGIVAEVPITPAAELPPSAWVDLPFEMADVSAPDIRAPMTSVQVRTGLWRTMRPVLDEHLCKRCSWVCSTLCPDSAISVRSDGTPEIDLDHCKGCLICVTVCPPHAIRAVPEPRAPEALMAGATT
jgi:pyruvate ferredoxin oxidoreductase gamma subunit